MGVLGIPYTKEIFMLGCKEEMFEKLWLKFWLFIKCTRHPIAKKLIFHYLHFQNKPRLKV